jgi:acyl-CoA synthetase (AMP-forming)/AMP-acid ligase II
MAVDPELLPAMTIGELLHRTAARYPERAALIDAADPSRRWTWAELHGEAVAGAHRLAATHRPGTTVAICAPSEPAWVVLELSCALAGLMVQPIDPAQEADLVAAALRKTAAATLAVIAAGSPFVAGDAAVPALREVIELGAGWRGPVAASLPTVTPAMGALVLPTSGTTGAPKAALLSHRAVTADARLVARRMGLSVDDTWLTAMPLHRSGGCATTVVGCVATGAAMVCAPTWAADDVLDLLDSTNTTVLSAFPRALHGVVDRLHGGVRRTPAGVRLVQTGGAPVSPNLVGQLETTLGARLSVVYGLTEASPVLTQTDQCDPSDEPAASVGRPLPGTELAVRDPESGGAVEPGRIGEVTARGPQIMDGYVGDPAATARAIDSEGWLHTGDLGWLDAAGRLHVEGRADDVITRDGRRWLPGPVERALAAVPGVADAVVVNGGHPAGDVVAFVRPRPDHALDELRLRAAVATACGEEQVPDRVVVVDELPALPSGKVRRFVLREWAVAVAH